MAYANVTAGLDEAALRLITGNRILRCLSADDLTALIRGGSVQSVETRQPLFEQGDEGRTVLVVLEGYLKLSSNTVSGREAILDIAGPGSVFGELAVLNGWPRAAGAVALTPCRLLVIDGQPFIRALLRAPEALLATVRLVSERLRTTTEQMTDAVDLPTATRLAKALLHLAAISSRIDAAGVHIEFHLSQRELGGLTGLTRESINKHLATLRDAGWIRLSGKDITLVNLAALRQDIAAHDMQ
jgi:CRP-like cAMP-binding protein